jgi:pimeloyl-ACP methyl ester carboxylesterase
MPKPTKLFHKLSTNLMLLLMPLGMLAACGGHDLNEHSANPYLEHQSDNYSTTTNWLCHPEKDLDDICDLNQDLTDVAADGVATVVPFKAAENPAADCFYIYPTVSTDPGPNSDFIAGLDERMTTQAQFARYASSCRPFAPVYRQVTLVGGQVTPVGRSFFEGASNRGDGNEILSEQEAGAGALAYGDVLDAFSYYMAHYNQGRPFLLIGHSQGAYWATKLVAEEIENHPYLKQRLVAAHIIGASVFVPAGETVGGSFASVPICTARQQSGCVVSYASYREGDPKLEEGRFAVSTQADMQVACTNPATLAAGRAPLTATLPIVKPPFTTAIIIPRGSGGPYANRAQNAAIATPFYGVKGQFFGECITHTTAEKRIDYLQLSIESDPADPRADDYAGEIIIPGFGLHIVDMSWPQQTLVALAAEQIQTWLSERPL